MHWHRLYVFRLVSEMLRCFVILVLLFCLNGNLGQLFEEQSLRMHNTFFHFRLNFIHYYTITSFSTVSIMTNLYSFYLSVDESFAFNNFVYLFYNTHSFVTDNKIENLKMAIKVWLADFSICLVFCLNFVIKSMFKF